LTYPTSLKLANVESGVEALCEVLHPMNAGDSGRSEVNYITQVVFRLNNRIQAEFLLGKYISRNPVIGTVLNNVQSGDNVQVSWQDIAGNRGQATATMK